MKISNTPGVDQLLGQSDLEDKPMEQDDKVVIVEEYQSEDPGSLLACGEKDLFSQEEDLSNSQLVDYVNAPTQEENPVVPARSQEVHDTLQPLPLGDWAEEVEHSCGPSSLSLFWTVSP